MQALPAFTLCLYPLESEILVRWKCLIIQLEATRPSSQSWRGGAQLQSSTWEGEAGGQEAYDQLGTYKFKASVAYIRPQIKKRKRKAKVKQTNKPENNIKYFYTPFMKNLVTTYTHTDTLS